MTQNTSSENTHANPCHHEEISRLNRIAGQVDGIKAMIMQGRYCPDILTQMRAVRSALKSVEANILERHLQACVTDAILHGDSTEQTDKIAELKTLFKRFED